MRVGVGVLGSTLTGILAHPTSFFDITGVVGGLGAILTGTTAALNFLRDGTGLIGSSSLSSGVAGRLRFDAFATEGEASTSLFKYKGSGLILIAEEGGVSSCGARVGEVGSSLMRGCDASLSIFESQRWSDILGRCERVLLKEEPVRHSHDVFGRGLRHARQCDESTLGIKTLEQLCLLTKWPSEQSLDLLHKEG